MEDKSIIKHLNPQACIANSSDTSDFTHAPQLTLLMFPKLTNHLLVYQEAMAVSNVVNSSVKKSQICRNPQRGYRVEMRGPVCLTEVFP